MVKANAFVRANADRMRWQLPPPGANIVDHAIGMITETLHEGYVKAFYIGLTHRLSERWEGAPSYRGREPMRGHKVAWQKMVIVGCSDHADEIGNAEISVIAQFRRHDRMGYMVNPNGHFLCRNQNPGGEGARGGVPPHLLYVCFSWNPRGR